MKFRKDNDQPLRAPNLSSTGAILYNNYYDDTDTHFVQVFDVVGGSGSGNGRFDTNLYRLVDIKLGDELQGHNEVTANVEITRNNNMPGFLRAIKNNIEKLLDEQKIE